MTTPPTDEEARGDRGGDRGPVAEANRGRTRHPEPRPVVALQRTLVGPTRARPPRPSLALTDEAPTRPLTAR